MGNSHAIWDHTVLPATHPAVVSIPCLPPDDAGTRFSDPGGMQGWVVLCYVKADWLGIEPVTCQSQVQRPTVAPPRMFRCCLLSVFVSHAGKLTATSFSQRAGVWETHPAANRPNVEQCRNVQKTDKTEGRHTAWKGHSTNGEVGSFQKDRCRQQTESED